MEDPRIESRLRQKHLILLEMYERIPLKEVGEESDLSNRKCMEILRLKAKGTPHKLYTLVDNVASHRRTVNNSDSIRELNN